MAQICAPLSRPPRIGRRNDDRAAPLHLRAIALCGHRVWSASALTTPRYLHSYSPPIPVRSQAKAPQDVAAMRASLEATHDRSGHTPDLRCFTGQRSEYPAPATARSQPALSSGDWSAANETTGARRHCALRRTFRDSVPPPPEASVARAQVGRADLGFQDLDAIQHGDINPRRLVVLATIHPPSRPKVCMRHRESRHRRVPSSVSGLRAEMPSDHA